jgi:hypothetical protein
MGMRDRRAAVIVAALALAACGGGGGDDGSSADTTATGDASTTTAIVEETTAPPSTEPAPVDGPSVDAPCSMISADEVSAILGAAVEQADEGYRCKYLAGADYVTVKLTDSSLQGSQDSFQYAADHGSLPPGLGDGAALLGLTLFVNVGDVQVVVDGSNFGGAQTDQVTEIARMVVGRIQ